MVVVDLGEDSELLLVRRPGQAIRNAWRIRSSRPPRHSRTTRSPRARAHSAKAGSFSSVRAWSGVFDRSRRGQAALGSARVEVLEHRVREGPLDVHVHAPPVAVGPSARGHEPLALELGPVEQRGRQRGLDARAAQLRVQEPADGQAEVANHLGLDPESVLPRQQGVARVAIGQVGPVPRRLTVSRGGDDQPDQALPAPAGRHELRRQPVEQLGVRRRFALEAEVLRRGDQAPAEELLPDRIDGHAGGERVGRVDEPAGQVVPIGLARRGRAAAGGTRESPAAPPRPGVRKSPRTWTNVGLRLGVLGDRQGLGAGRRRPVVGEHLRCRARPP